MGHHAERKRFHHSPPYAPTAVCKKSNWVDLFYRGTNDNIYVRTWNGSSWSSATNLGGIGLYAPDAASTGSNCVEVFTVGTDEQMYHNWKFDGQNWSGWYALGGQCTGTPGAISRGNWTDVFYRGADSNVWCINWNGQQWNPNHYNMGCPPNGVNYHIRGVDAASRNTNHVAIVCVGADYNLYIKEWFGYWTGWISLGAPSAGIAGDPQIMSKPGTGLLEVFVIAKNGAIYSRTYDPNAGYWGAWQDQGGPTW